VRPLSGVKSTFTELSLAEEMFRRAQPAVKFRAVGTRSAARPCRAVHPVVRLVARIHAKRFDAEMHGVGHNIKEAKSLHSVIWLQDNLGQCCIEGRRRESKYRALCEGARSDENGFNNPATTNKQSAQNNNPAARTK